MLVLTPFIMTLLIVEGIIVFFGFIAFIFSIKIYKKYNFNENTSYQYNLAKQGYLVSIIVFFILCIKLPLFLFFVWSMDVVSSLIPGAMCAAGIVDATDYGIYMFIFKILNLFFLSGWLLINYEDSKTKNSSFLKTKFKFFIPIFILLALEFLLEFLHFSGISLTEPVLCCSDIFKANDLGELKLWHTDKFILSIFYLFFILNFISAYYKADLLISIFSLLFMLSAIYAIIRFFSPYIYELPTHKCPFCMLQSDYGYIGYPIYILIYLGAVPGFFIFILELLNVKIEECWYKISMYANLALVGILSYFPLAYYIKNGVWL
ncbi:putative membrane protein [Campylobacter blaseri]|uniref:Uncharacterized protein n=1 Tax=Campylobacter blaseri TaxID=2042961 RepID=A0A2P8R0F6_9BACT|nr:hypothetical protein [Campylobacter blaseri]PSM51985.1 hypothetical protein CQ405_05325 [Campylobacter blaseri]PSM53770.1 hypothetical protein CRN67_05325 [Campylobacter blaseri]QKF85676.1 putative membrane protein [Campylobacter blaseri]